MYKHPALILHDYRVYPIVPPVQHCIGRLIKTLLLHPLPIQITDNQLVCAIKGRVFSLRLHCRCRFNSPRQYSRGFIHITLRVVVCMISSPAVLLMVHEYLQAAKHYTYI